MSGKRFSVSALLKLLGIEARQRGHKWMARCPAHPDRSPSWAIVDAPGTERHGSHHCFSGDTRVLTWDGFVPIRDLVGKQVRVITSSKKGPTAQTNDLGRWVTAKFESFGEQEVWEIRLARDGREKVIRATSGHRWFVRTTKNRKPAWAERTTEHLAPGHTLRSFRYPRFGRIVPSPWGVSGLSLFFKRFPDIDESPSYLYGWLAGYFAVDGCVSDAGAVTIASAARENLEFVERVCIRLGIFTFGIQQRVGNGTEPSDIFSLTLSRTSLTEDFFLVSEHRDRWLRHNEGYERRRWHVVSVTPTGRTEEVFCAVVPETHAFVIEGGILTGNCFACGFGGGPWELAAAVWSCSVSEAGARLRRSFIGQDEPGPLSSLVPIVKVTYRSREDRGVRMPAGVVFPEHIDDWRCTPARRYVLSRAADWQVERWGMGYALEGRLAYRVVIPVYTAGVLATYVARAFLPGGMHRHDAGRRVDGALSDQAVFGEPRLRPQLGVVTVAEGAFSMLALERDGAPNPCGLLGSHLTMARALVLSRYRTIVVASDPDEAGEKLYRQIVGQLGRTDERVIVRARFRVSPDDAEPGEAGGAVRVAIAQANAEHEKLSACV